MARAQKDAAYGLGVQRAVYLAARPPAGGAMDAAVTKASANVHPVSSSDLRVQG
jgi:hypothetical protein